MELVNLTTGYSGKSVTSGITARLLCGELTCLLGPNGAGKSTLLKTLCSFIPPVSGDIMLEGRSTRAMGAKTLARHISVVLTDRLSATNMTVEELVGMGRSPYSGFFGKMKSEDYRIVAESIEMVGISEMRQRNVAMLSDGERQKTLIAKALAQQTPIIILDEPTSFLDFPSRVDTMRLLRRIAHMEQKTVLVSTHDLELALQLADRIWLLDRQHGLNIDTPAALASNGLLPEYFKSDGMRFEPSTLRFEICADEEERSYNRCAHKG